MIDLNKLAQEIHAAAVEKGFWNVEDAETKHVAKMHSELSEALQEDRMDRPMLYVDDIQVLDRITDPAQFDGRKPEGVAAELADFVMMLLDYAVQEEIKIPKEARQITDEGKKENSYPANVHNLVYVLHEGVVIMDGGLIPWIMSDETHVEYMLCLVYTFLHERGIDLWQVIRLKMAYNKNRPPLHGRKY